MTSDIRLIGTVVTYASWGLLALVWITTARFGHLKDVQATPRRRERDIASTVAAAGAAFALLTPTSWWEPLSYRSLWLLIAGIVVLACATTFTAWSRRVLGPMWTSAPSISGAASLRTSGPYGLTRHPIYTGVCAMLAGTAMAQGLGRWALIGVVVCLALVFKALQEERLLQAEFPRDYLTYRETVPFLIPWPPRVSRHTDEISK